MTIELTFENFFLQPLPPAVRLHTTTTKKKRRIKKKKKIKRKRRTKKIGRGKGARRQKVC